MAAAVAAALWTETGGDRERYAAALAVAVGMAEVPEVDAVGSSAAQSAGRMIIDRGSAGPEPVAVAVAVLGATLPTTATGTVRDVYGTEAVVRLAVAAAEYGGAGLDAVARVAYGRARLGDGWDR